MTGEQVQRPPSPAIVIALCAAYGIYCLLKLPPGPVTAPDSYGYLIFAPIRSLGYPIFLRLLGPGGIMVVQPVLFAVALGSLGIQTLRLTSSVLLPSAVVVAAMFIPELQTYHYSVLSESLFISGTLACLACIVAFVRRPSVTTAAVAAACAALTSTVRSAAVAYVPVVVVMVLLSRACYPRTRTALVAVLIVAAVIVGGERLGALAIHADRFTSLAGRHSFAKAALVDAPPVIVASSDPVVAQFEQELDVSYAPMRAFLSSAPASLRPLLTLFYEVCLTGPCVAELGDEDRADTPQSVNARLETAGLGRLTRAPWEYVTLTASEYRSLWTAFRLKDPETVQELNSFVATHRPLPMEGKVFNVGPHDPLVFTASAPVRFVNPVVTALGLFTAVLAAVGLLAAMATRPLTPVLMAASLVALAAHSALLYSAMLAPGIGRFMLALWSSVTTASLLGVWGTASLMLDRWKRRALSAEGQVIG